jgi:hypothetical protein
LLHALPVGGLVFVSNAGGERFFRWEQDRRISLYLTGHSMPLPHTLAEDYLLEEVAAGETRFTYSMGIEPRLTLSIGGPIART